MERACVLSANVASDQTTNISELESDSRFSSNEEDKLSTCSRRRAIRA
jgi:hypothetical protein